MLPNQRGHARLSCNRAGGSSSGKRREGWEALGPQTLPQSSLKDGPSETWGLARTPVQPQAILIFVKTALR